MKRHEPVKNGPDDRLAIPLQEAARKLSLGRNAAYAAAESGQIPTVRIGRKILVPVAALKRLLADDGIEAA